MVHKIIQLEDLKAELALCRAAGKSIVFTNGCFDILHPGHVNYLAEAKDLGDVLIVGVNSDASVAGLKGPERPLNNLQDRKIMLAALSSVDYVIDFNEETPLRLIKSISPNILVKGGDYSLDQIVGASFVIDNGGEVKSLAFTTGHSTSQLILKIQALKHTDEG